ncbi:MAG: hypothetical protein IH591_09525 [Bacteroidales bacterium]|nr:hypothetical protein [Bacteroidales bacterium]
MLEREFKYYRDHQEELVKLFNGRTLVIIGEKVVGDYESFEEALIESQEKYEPGTYLIQKCAPGEDNFTHTFHTRAIFA